MIAHENIYKSVLQVPIVLHLQPCSFGEGVPECMSNPVSVAVSTLYDIGILSKTGCRLAEALQIATGA